VVVVIDKVLLLDCGLSTISKKDLSLSSDGMLVSSRLSPFLGFLTRMMEEDGLGGAPHRIRLSRMTMGMISRMG
jgi:hypothetical protein